jgi:hypothetical protein
MIETIFAEHNDPSIKVTVKIASSERDVESWMTIHVEECTDLRKV